MELLLLAGGGAGRRVRRLLLRLGARVGGRRLRHRCVLPAASLDGTGRVGFVASSHAGAFAKDGAKTGSLSTPRDCSPRLVEERDECEYRLPDYLRAGDGSGTNAERGVASDAATGGMDGGVGNQLLLAGSLRAAGEQTNGGDAWSG